MSRSIPRLAVGAVTLSLMSAAHLSAQNQFPFQYAAKIVCGRPAELARLTPQTYATAINVHNPSDSLPTFVFKKLALTSPPGRQIPGKVIRISIDTLRPDEALLVDCQDVARRTGVGISFEGFIVLESPQSLDVTAVYAVQGGIDVEQVHERRVP